MNTKRAGQDYCRGARQDMYEWGPGLKAGAKKKARRCAVPCEAKTELVFLVFFIFLFEGLDAAIVSSLRFRVFHGFLGFCGALGANFSALFLLLIENLLAAEKFEEGLVGA